MDPAPSSYLSETVPSKPQPHYETPALPRYCCSCSFSCQLQLCLVVSVCMSYGRNVDNMDVLNPGFEFGSSQIPDILAPAE